MPTSDLGLVLLTGAAVVLAAIVAARLAHGIGLPGLLVFLGLGLALSCFRRGSARCSTSQARPRPGS